jgi:hypothetical protein
MRTSHLGFENFLGSFLTRGHNDGCYLYEDECDEDTNDGCRDEGQLLLTESCVMTPATKRVTGLIQTVYSEIEQQFFSYILKISS